MTTDETVEVGLDDIKQIVAALADELGALGLVGRLELRPRFGRAQDFAALNFSGTVHLQPEEPDDFLTGDLWTAGVR